MTKNLKKKIIAWKSGQDNTVEYFTKHHYAKHNKRVRTIYLHTDKTPRSVQLFLLKPSLQGCVDPADYKMGELSKAPPIYQI